MLLKLRQHCYEALYVHESGVYSRENVSSTNALLTDKKICSKYLFETRFQKVLLKN